MTGYVPAWGTPVAPPVNLYAVAGVFVARHPDPGHAGSLSPRYPRAGQRFFDHIEADSPRDAEDKARAEFSGQVEDGVTYDLEVCAVLIVAEGRIKPVDTYATFLDPDRPEEAAR